MVFLVFCLTLCAAAAVHRTQGSREHLDRVILITIDTLRADHLPFYGYPRDTAPFLSALAERSAVFDLALSASSHTSPSHGSLFTSMYPYQHGLLSNWEDLPEGIPTMAQAFRDRDFKTAGFTSVGFLSGLKSGFETFSPPGRAGDGRGEATVQRTISWLNEQGHNERFLLWVHLFDVHGWKQRRSSYTGFPDINRHVDGYVRNRYTAGELDFAHNAGWPVNRVLDAYDGRILYVDRILSRLFDVVGKRFPQENTLWIITSDHGEGLANHLYLGHGMHLYQEQLHVPLLFYFADGSHAGKRIGVPMRLIDILPTLADLAGLAPDGDLKGTSLVPVLSNPEKDFVHYSFAQRRPADRRKRATWIPMCAIQEGLVKFIYRADGVTEHYNLFDDPYERTNLFLQTDRKDIPLRDTLRTLYQEAQKMQENRPRMKSSEERIHELRSLGYIQ